MGKALELITVQATAPGAGATFLAVAGNSLTIRDTREAAWFAAAFSTRQTGGFMRYTSPLLHDAVVGMQFAVDSNAGLTARLHHWGCLQQLYAQDTLIAFGSGSGTAGDIEFGSFLVAYEDLPGVDAYLIDEAELRRRADDVYAFQNTLATGTTGGYSGSEVLSAEQDQLKANTDYAIIGYTVTVPAHAIRYVGQDWGNLGLGGPGLPNESLTQDWFVRLSAHCKMPLIPVFNSSNKTNTFVDAAQNENGADTIVSTITVRLSPKGSGKKQ